MYLPHTGGVERYSFLLSGELAGRGFDVFVVASSCDGEPAETADERGVRIFRVPGVTVASGRLPIPFPSGIQRKLRKALSGYAEVRVLIQTNLYLLSAIGARFAEKNGFPSAVIIHGANTVCTGNSLTDRLEHRYERAIAAYERRTGARFAAVSKAGAVFAGSLGCRAEEIAYNSPDPAELAAVSPDRYSLREKHGLPDDAVIFTFSGRLIREKGVLPLAEAFRRIREQDPRAFLIIAGSGPLYDALNSRHHPGMILTGQLSHADMLSVFRQTDCLILPSDAEGLPTVVLEAAACGAYVITAPYGGMPEAVELSGNGRVMDGNSAEDIFLACADYMEKCSGSGEARTPAFRLSWTETADALLRLTEPKNSL